MNSHVPPPTIIVRGINIGAEIANITEEVLCEDDGTVRFNIDINLDQFYRENKMYTNSRGWLSAQIVKRKTPSAKGHTHFIRVATSKCSVGSVEPVRVDKNSL